jgi:4-aminobutyrate aminotransferase
MAKGIANGLPVGATTTRDEIARAWKGKTISTFGGNPICMSAVDATLGVMVRENVPKRSAERGRQLREGLEALYEEHPWIGDVRGMGLMQGMELVEDRTSKEPSPKKGSALLEATKEEGLLIGIGGMHGHVARVSPQMLVTEEEVADAIGRLSRACQKVSSAS